MHPAHRLSEKKRSICNNFLLINIFFYLKITLVVMVLLLSFLVYSYKEI